METVNAVNAMPPVNPALFDHLEWKAEQILGQLRAGLSLDRLCAVYEVPPDVLRACLARWEPEVASEAG